MGSAAFYSERKKPTCSSSPPPAPSLPPPLHKWRYITCMKQLWQNIGSFWSSQRMSNFLVDFLTTIFFIFLPVKMLWDGVWGDGAGRGGGRWRSGVFDVNEDTDTEIWGFYGFVLSVKYEKELKGRLLKRRAVAYVNEICFRAIICNRCRCSLFIYVFIFSDGYLKFFLVASARL